MANKIKKNLQVKTWKELNKEKVLAQKARARDRAKAKKLRDACQEEGVDVYKYKDEETRRYKLSSAINTKRTWEERISKHGAPEKCEICSVDIPIAGGHKGAQWDHCHESGEFRGWLCSPCNMALGCMKDNHVVALNAAQYLARHKKVSCESEFTSRSEEFAQLQENFAKSQQLNEIYKYMVKDLQKAASV